MTDYQIEVRITPRQGLLDPQGKAVQSALRSMEFASVDAVRVGRLIRLRLKANSPEDAKAQADAMCRRLLANPVTEDYEIDLRTAG